MCVLVSLRRSSGGGVPRGREGHGTAGGSGVRSGPDHPLRHHFLLARPGHSVKQDPRTSRRTDGETRATEPSRRLEGAHHGRVCGRRGGRNCSGPFFLRLDAREGAPPGGVGPCSFTATITLQFRGNSIQAGYLCVGEQHQAETAPSSACRLESHVLGVYRVTSLLCANSLLWDIQMPLWPLTLEGFLLHLLGKKNKRLFFFFL